MSVASEASASYGCQQCSLDIWSRDTRDMAGLSTLYDTQKGLFALALCEDCGYVQVDHEGRCVSPDCLKQHGKVAA